MDMPLEQEWKKGSAELLILSLLEDQPRHGYDIGKLIESRSGGKLRFHIASLYPLLYRLENRGWIQGRWVEKPNQRRRRYSYVLTGFGTDWVGEAEIGAWELRAGCRTFILLPERIWSGHWPFPVSGARLAGFSRG